MTALVPLALLALCTRSLAGRTPWPELVEPCAVDARALPPLARVARETRARLFDVLALSNIVDGAALLFGGAVERERTRVEQRAANCVATHARAERHDTDTELAFRQESNFLYLSQVHEPDFALLLDVARRSATLVAPARDRTFALWNGVVLSHAELKRRYAVDDVIAHK